MKFSAEALVIREKNIGESDRLLTLLTKEQGIIKAFASGVKNYKSKKSAGTSLLSFSNFLLEEKGDTYRVREVSPIRVFFGAGDNIKKLALSQYFCELALVLAPMGTESAEFLRLILNSLHFLSVGKMNVNQLKAVTELKIIALSGYSPELVCCEGCGCFENDIMYFNLNDGALWCDKCKTGGNLRPIGKTELSAMRHVLFSPFDKIYNFSVPVECAAALSKLTEDYLVTQTEHRFATLDFYNSIPED